MRTRVLGKVARSRSKLDEAKRKRAEVRGEVQDGWVRLEGAIKRRPPMEAAPKARKEAFHAALTEGLSGLGQPASRRAAKRRPLAKRSMKRDK